LQTQLNSLIDDFCDSNSPLSALEDVGSDTLLEGQHPQLAQLSAVLGETRALVEGRRHVVFKAFEFHLVSCLRVAIEAHVEETLREAGKALHVEVIAESSVVSPTELGRVLRLLAANHIFREVEEGVFARNHPSSILDTGKSVEALTKDPDNSWNQNGFYPALIAHFGAEGIRMSSFLADTLFSPELARSEAPGDTVFAQAYGVSDVFDYLGSNPRALKRFSAAMQGVGSLLSAEGESALMGYPWKDLPKGSRVIDVGGGSGQLCLAIGSAVPHLNFVVQDRKEVIEGEAPIFWENSASSEVRSRVELQAHNFFTPQPVKSAAAYVLRAVIHDWPTAKCIEILQHIADAADKDSTLVLIESTINPLSPPNPFPPPTTLPYLVDLQMLCLNAQERTESQYKALGLEAGWELAKVWKTGENGEDGAFRHYEFRLKG